MAMQRSVPSFPIRCRMAYSSVPTAIIVTRLSRTSPPEAEWWLPAVDQAHRIACGQPKLDPDEKMDDESTHLAFAIHRVGFTERRLVLHRLVPSTIQRSGAKHQRARRCFLALRSRSGRSTR
jgi:hypothetical protein